MLHHSLSLIVNDYFQKSKQHIIYEKVIKFIKLRLFNQKLKTFEKLHSVALQDVFVAAFDFKLPSKLHQLDGNNSESKLKGSDE